MAEQHYKKKTRLPCPRCQCKEARITVFHIGTTWRIECAECGFGEASGHSEEQVMARQYGIYLGIKLERETREKEQRRLEKAKPKLVEKNERTTIQTS